MPHFRSAQRAAPERSGFQDPFCVSLEDRSLIANYEAGMLPEKNLPWWKHDRPWGFRFSIQDAVIFVSGVMATALSWQQVGQFALFIPFLLCHFFLFCNTFRVGGERTLIWASVFIINVFLWAQTQSHLIHVATQVTVTSLLIANCVFGRNYHGFACEWINSQNYRNGALAEGAFTRRVLIACRVPRPLIELLVGRRLSEFDSEETSNQV